MNASPALTATNTASVSVPTDAQATARLTLNIPVSVAKDLKQLASIEQTTVTEIIRRAISAEKFLREQTQIGNEVLILEKNTKKPTRVVFR
jgi:hypothetical protein